MHLFDRNLDHDSQFELLGGGGAGRPSQLLGVLLHTTAMFGLSRVRTESSCLLVVPFLAHHPVQPEWPTCGPSLLSQSSARVAWPGENTCSAIPAGCARSLAPLPPAGNAAACC